MGERTVLFNAMNISVQWCLYITVLKKNSTKKARRMHHFLQPGGTSNEKYIYFAYRFSKLSCEGGSIYQGKYTVILPQRQQTRRD